MWILINRNNFEVRKFVEKVLHFTVACENSCYRREQRTSVTYLLDILVYQASRSLTLQKSEREGLPDVISMHEMLINQILLFDFETVATPWLQYVRLLLVQF